MSGKSKTIGTSRGETPFVNWARENGFPLAERHALKGNKDEGDVVLDPLGKLIVEVKAGAVAERSEPAWLADAMSQLEMEMLNYGAEAGLLVTKRKGYGDKRVGDWWAWCWMAQAELVGEMVMLPFVSDPKHFRVAIPVRMTVTDAIRLLRMDGYGDPL